jgi:hypothetical protein
METEEQQESVGGAKNLLVVGAGVFAPGETDGSPEGRFTCCTYRYIFGRVTKLFKPCHHS